MRRLESPGHGHAKTTVFRLVGFAVGLYHVCTGVGCSLRNEDGSTDWRCGVAFKEVFVEVLLNGGDKPLLGGAGAEGWTKWLEEESRLVHLLRECDLWLHELGTKPWRGGEEGVRVWGLSGSHKRWKNRLPSSPWGKPHGAAQLSQHRVLQA